MAGVVPPGVVAIEALADWLLSVSDKAPVMVRGKPPPSFDDIRVVRKLATGSAAPTGLNPFTMAFRPSEVDELVTFLDVIDVASTCRPPDMRLAALVPRFAPKVATAEVSIKLKATAA